MDARQIPADDGDPPALLNAGTYSAIYIAHRGMMAFRTPKLEMQFRLFEHPDIVLSRWYRVTGYKNRISAPIQSDLVREIQAALNRRIRLDRIPLELLKDKPVIVDVKVVTIDKTQHELAPVNRYNVIERIRGPA